MLTNIPYCGNIISQGGNENEFRFFRRNKGVANK
nr:MAG TPA: hypothetical protein [Bacteriophage sp.]